jgi:cell wall-associated NlpC family hydrolase
MTRDDVQREARKIVGAEWVHQGRDPASGIDCIGVIVWVGKQLGVESDDRTNYSREPVGELLVDEFRQRFDEIPISQAREGDILILRNAGKRLPTHVAILARGQMEYMLIHSIQISSARKTVEEPYRRWARLVTHAFRFRGLED